jgi:sec-independent protein translocase protein TatA
MVFPSMPIGFLSNFGGFDGLIVLVVALLIFGRKLPDVGKNLGRTIVEFKKGLSGAGDEAKEEQPPEEAAPQRRLSSGSRVSVNPPARTSRALPKTEEV